MVQAVVPAVQRPADAANDLVTLLPLADDVEAKGLSAIWLHIARARSRLNDQREFEQNSQHVPLNEWPRPLLDLFDNKTTVSAVFAKSKEGDPDLQQDQACDADFYVGEYYLSKNQKALADIMFQAVTKDCRRTDTEFGFALAELRNSR